MTTATRLTRKLGRDLPRLSKIMLASSSKKGMELRYAEQNQCATSEIETRRKMIDE
jgi:hypothetical protein